MANERQSDGSVSPHTQNPASTRQRIGFWLGLVLFAVIEFFVEIDPSRESASHMAAVATLMAVWWMTEAIPIPATAFLPVALFPLLGIMRGSEVAPIYIDSNIFLFTGGFLIALAMERWNLHKRIALMILLLIGGQPHRLVLGFMLATALLSMWISNTATTMMLMPMGLSLVLLYQDLNRGGPTHQDAVDPRTQNFPVALMLSIGYAASIGGIGTIIGTPPNVVMVSIFEREFSGAPPISFAQWALFAVPLSMVFLLLSWVLLCWFIYPLPARGPFSNQDFIRSEVKKLGRIGFEEVQVLVVFAAAALLWMFRRDIAIGDTLTIPGWASILPHGSMIDDGTVAMTMGTLLFLLPSRSPGRRLMDWETAKGVPWGILILFGGGFALAGGITASGLSEWVGARFTVLDGVPAWAAIMTVAGVITGVTEMTSNTATTAMVQPILASLARTIEVHPLLLMIPAAVAASCAFMLPVATPPNAIVYSSGQVSIGQMVRAGVILNLVGVLLVSVFVLTLALPVFGISTTALPTWMGP